MRNIVEVVERAEALRDEMERLTREITAAEVVGPLTNPIESLTRRIALKETYARDEGALNILLWVLGQP